ncbi:MAG: cation diffusion facilitator family transporter [Dehalococcoidia bacterium]|nr:cation diffusion facilitator family transporter [Dehalococcoidia bacterium]
MNSQGFNSLNRRAAGLSIISNVFIIGIELTASFVTGSVSILAGAINSVVDLSAAVVAFFSVRISAKPADEQHPYGHGKVENIAGTIEAGLLFIGAFFIIYGGVKKIISGAELFLPEAGILIMLVSITLNVIVSLYLHKVARKTESLAIEGEAKHINADILTSVGIIAGLALVRLTDIHILDPLIAIAIAVWIIVTAFNLTRKSIGGLVDVKLPAAEEKLIADCIMEHCRELIGFHKLRTRKAGAERYVDLHLVMSRAATLEEVHQMCDHLEEDIHVKLANATVTIHVEPCESECADCTITCPENTNNT